MGYQIKMTLDQYLRKNKTTSRQFADAIDVSIFAVRKWRQSVRTPRAAFVKKIELITSGQVKPKDWYQ